MSMAVEFRSLDPCNKNEELNESQESQLRYEVERSNQRPSWLDFKQLRNNE